MNVELQSRNVAIRLRIAFFACGVAIALNAVAGSPPLLLNPFGDPFLQATHGRPCPQPLGPAYTEAERRGEAHSRIERGTSCWLAGTCTEPNAYRYDRRIADAAVAALRADPTLTDSAIWVVAQRRFVELQGCAASAAQIEQARARVQAVHDVERVLLSLSLPGEPPRYRLAPSVRR